MSQRRQATAIMIFWSAYRVVRGLTPLIARQLKPALISRSSLAVHHYQIQLFASSKDSTTETDFDIVDVDTGIFFESFQDDDNDDDDTEFTEQNDDTNDDHEHQLNPILDEYLAWAKAVQSTLQQLAKKKLALQRELEKSKLMDQTVNRAQLIVSNLYLFKHMTTATVQDWDQDGVEREITLDPKYDSAVAESDALFAQARKIKRGTAVVQDLLDTTEDAVGLMEELQRELELVSNEQRIDEDRLRFVQSRLERTAKQTRFQLPLPPQEPITKQRSPSSKSVLETSVRKLTSPGGSIVLVGRNRKGNDFISTQVAKGKDIWMHARGCPGAHVVLKSRPGSPKVTQACLDFCANVAAFYSDYRTETKAEITVADPKHVLKPRGAPLGAVKVREELYTLTGWPDRVSEELKLAREQSGKSDEFRAKDKQKHRRQTADVAKQTQLKKRAEQKSKRKKGGQTKDTSEILPDFF